MRNGWTPPGPCRVARHQEPRRRLQGAAGRERVWKGASRAGVPSYRPGVPACSRPIAQGGPRPGDGRAQSPPEPAQPTRRVILVPRSHLDPGEGPGPRSKSQLAEEADWNPEPGQGHRASSSGPEPRRPPGSSWGPGRAADPAVGAQGAWASGSLSKRRNSSPPAL